MTTKITFQVKFEHDIDDISESFLANILNFAVISLYGQVGGSQIQYRLLDIDAENHQVAIETPNEDASKLWCALTLLGYYGSTRIRVKVTSEALLQEIEEIMV
ncbi:unnamed protein product [Blepharisma stoltei]|uniref:Uncharacterized protein n=1 Tax=Blepharisma stoltei TaxID=1481888 RepID=A0AAU9JTK2_9CILI|nr:unnamed protein product [Blepharisma stoltei]